MLLEAAGRWPTIPSKICRACQPNRIYRPAQMTIKQIKEAVSNGLVRAPVAEPVLKRKVRVAKQEQREAVVRRWEARRLAPWREAQAALGLEIVRTRARLLRTPANEFLTRYLEECLRLRGVVALKIREATHVWQGWDKLVVLEGSPDSIRSLSIRQPLLLFTTSSAPSGEHCVAEQ